MTAAATSFLDVERLLASTFVRAVEVHEELRSTNDWALLQPARFQELPALIAAARQTSGRGRGANRWWATDGALTFTLILDPRAFDLPLVRWPEVSLTAGAAVCEAVAAAAPSHDVRLKWPNDVYLDDRKVCGILVEAPSSTEPRLVVGIGVNVNNSLIDAAAEIRSRATSLIDATGVRHDRTDLLSAILRQFESDLRRLSIGDVSLRARWRRRCFLTGRSVTLNDGARSITGTCLGIEDDGALCLHTEAGPQRFYGGVVESFDPERSESDRW